MKKQRLPKSHTAGGKVWLCKGWRGQAGLEELFIGWNLQRFGKVSGRQPKVSPCILESLWSRLFYSEGPKSALCKASLDSRYRHSLLALCVFWRGCSHLENTPGSIPCERDVRVLLSLKGQIFRVCRAIQWLQNV